VIVAVPNPANEGRTERDRAGASHRAMGALRRGRFDVLGRSPFRTTLYVDADALACRSLESIFEAVERNGSQWAFCTKNNHFHKRRDGSRYHEPRDERHAVALFRGFPDLAMPDLTSPFANAGFIVYRPFDEEVRELLRTWRRVYDLGYAKKVSVDQPSRSVWKSNFGRLTPSTRRFPVTHRLISTQVALGRPAQHAEPENTSPRRDDVLPRPRQLLAVRALLGAARELRHRAHTAREGLRADPRA